MHLATVLSAVALAAGGTEAARRGSRGGAHGRRMGPGHMYKSKNHQRIHSMAAAFVEPSVSIDATTSSKNIDKPPTAVIETMTVTASVSTPRVVVTNTATTVTAQEHENHRGHGFHWGDGFFNGPRKTSTCTSGVITITETVMLTVSVTASASAASESGVDFHRNHTRSWPHHPGNGTTDCTTTASATLGTASSSAWTDSTWTTSSHTEQTSISTSTTRRTKRKPNTTHHHRSPTGSGSSISAWSTTSCNETTHTHSHPSTAPLSPFPWSTTTTTAAATTTPSFPVKTILVTLSSVSPQPSPSDCVIDPLVTPVLTASPFPSLSLPSPSSSSIPSAPSTVCALSTPSGKPNPGNTHCGVRGRPLSLLSPPFPTSDKQLEGVENSFLARFTENAPGVPATLQGCWQICGHSVWGVGHGCAAYVFTYNSSSGSSEKEKGQNGGRCDLYGGRVASSLAEVDNREEGVWFDLECGDPRVTGSHALERWEGMNGNATVTEEEEEEEEEQGRGQGEGQGGW